MSDWEQREAYLRKAVELLEDLTTAHPSVPDYRHDLSETYAMPEVPRVVPDAKDPDAQRRWQESLKGTRESLQKALEISESLVAEHPSVPDYATSQVRIRLALAEAFRGLGDPQAAAACERQAGELFSGR